MLHFITSSTQDINNDDDINYEEMYKDCMKVKSDSVESVTYTEFEKQVAILFEDCFDTLVRKDVEYAGHGDAFEAFREAAQVEGVIPEEIARRYRLKHDMSLKKMINDLQNDRDENLTEEFIKEKCGDIICYTALIYGMLMERIHNEVQICE
ncbi:MAG: hypothetical protein WC343_04475 [Bacilli bacterium]|jgi:hypothetical protein